MASDGPAARSRLRAGGMWLALVLALVPVLALPAAAAPGAGPAGGPVARTDAELARLRDFLVGADRTFSTRRDAAEVLLEKDSAPASAILVAVLSGPTPSEPALAVLDAVAARDAAPEALIDPLFLLLRGEDEATRRAAALAFGAYQGSGKVLAPLREAAVAPNAAVGVRVAAVQALAQIMDKRSIEALVQLTADPKAPVASAAAEALADMTGARDLGPARDAWAEWWQRHKDAPESRLLGGLLRRFRDELRRRDASLERVQARLIRQLTDLYDAADAKEKGRLALAQLEDPVPQVRAVAARQAGAMARGALAAGNGSARQPYQELMAALLKHISDESPMVRAAAAEALAAWQEQSAVPVLVARLDAEKASEVRAAVAAALGGLKVVEAVPKLVAMLDAAGEIEVLRAAGALGLIGEKSGANAAAVEPALKPLGRLARTAGQPAIREAACLALAKIAAPSVEEVLAAALDDPTPSVRFAAAQGLGNLGKAGEKTVAALVSRLQDENKGVRQAVAAALAKLGGPDVARQMADRIKAGAEAEPAVRNALWDAVRALADRGTAPDLAQELGDRFFSREGAEEMQRAAAMYEIALTKIPAAGRNTPPAQILYEKLVDAYIAAGAPDSAVPPLRQLLIITPPENKTRLRELNQQLGLVLLAKEPYAEGVPPLVAAMDGADAAVRATILKAIQTRAEALLKAEKAEAAMDLLAALGRARLDWGGTDLTDALKQLRDQAAGTAAGQAVAKLTGADDQAAAAAAATLKKIGRPAVDKLLDALEAAAKGNQPAAEARILAALETLTGRKDHGYALQAPLDDRMKKIAAWRQAP